MKQDTVTPEIQQLLRQLASSAGNNANAAAEGFNQFLPGGGGGQAISDAAHRRFQQETIPSILGAFGQNVKGSSSLNNALASGASNLNSDIASKLAEMQLQASQGLSNQAANQANTAAGTQQFAYQPRQQPLWQSALLAGIGGGSKIAQAYAGRPPGL